MLFQLYYELNIRSINSPNGLNNFQLVEISISKCKGMYGMANSQLNLSVNCICMGATVPHKLSLELLAPGVIKTLCPI